MSDVMQLGSAPAVAPGIPSIDELFLDPALDGHRVELTSGTVVTEPGSAADEVYFVERGQVRVYQLGPCEEGRLLEILGPGQWFGCAALSSAGQHHTRAVAVGKVVLTAVKGERLLAYLAERPAAAVAVVRQLAEGIRSAREDAARLVFDDCNSRLVKTLIRFSRSAAATAHADGLTVLHITHEQLAQAIGVARETVSLALTEMRHQNLVRTGRNQLAFNPDVLQRFAAARATSGRANGTHVQVEVEVESAA